MASKANSGSSAQNVLQYWKDYLKTFYQRNCPTTESSQIPSAKTVEHILAKLAKADDGEKKKDSEAEMSKSKISSSVWLIDYLLTLVGWMVLVSEKAETSLMITNFNRWGRIQDRVSKRLEMVIALVRLRKSYENKDIDDEVTTVRKSIQNYALQKLSLLPSFPYKQYGQTIPFSYDCDLEIPSLPEPDLDQQYSFVHGIMEWAVPHKQWGCVDLLVKAGFSMEPFLDLETLPDKFLINSSAKKLAPYFRSSSGASDSTFLEKESVSVEESGLVPSAT